MDLFFRWRFWKSKRHFKSIIIAKYILKRQAVKNKMKYFFTKLGIVFIKLIALLPFSVLYLISNILYILLYKVASYRLKVVRENLKNSFPKKTYDERLVIEKKY